MPAAVALDPAVAVPVIAVARPHPAALDPYVPPTVVVPVTGNPYVPGTRGGDDLGARWRRRDADVDVHAGVGKTRHARRARGEQQGQKHSAHGSFSLR